MFCFQADKGNGRVHSLWFFYQLPHSDPFSKVAHFRVTELRSPSLSSHKTSHVPFHTTDTAASLKFYENVGIQGFNLNINFSMLLLSEPSITIQDF